jgi:hypothetical protein
MKTMMKALISIGGRYDPEKHTTFSGSVTM